MDVHSPSRTKPSNKRLPPTNRSRVSKSISYCYRNLFCWQTPINPYSSGHFSVDLRAAPAQMDFAKNVRNGPPPNKKARVDDGVRIKRKILEFSNIEPSRPRPLGDSNDTGVIHVEDEYENVGQPVQRVLEADDLGLTSRAWKFKPILPKRGRRLGDPDDSIYVDDE